MLLLLVEAADVTVATVIHQFRVLLVWLSLVIILVQDWRTIPAAAALIAYRAISRKLQASEKNGLIVALAIQQQATRLAT